MHFALRAYDELKIDILSPPRICQANNIYYFPTTFCQHISQIDDAGHAPSVLMPRARAVENLSFLRAAYNNVHPLKHTFVSPFCVVVGVSLSRVNFQSTIKKIISSISCQKFKVLLCIVGIEV